MAATICRYLTPTRALLIAITWAPGTAAGAASYSIQAFGLSPLRPVGASINDAGQRLLYLDTSAMPVTPPVVLYGNYHTIPLGSFGPASAAQNNLGAIVGTVPIGTGETEIKRWSMPHRFDVTTFDGPFAMAGLNDSEQFVGISSDGISARSFLGDVNAGTLTDMGSLGGAYTYASGLNNNGQIVGVSKTGATQADFDAGRAVEEAFLYENGQMRGLGTIAGPYSFARAINDLGQVVGDSSTTPTGAGVTHAFLYDETHGMRDIGNPGLISVALDLNNQTEIIGIEIGGDGTFHAFIHSPSKGMQYLEHLIPADSGWTNLSQATSINNCGQIVGVGTLNGRTRAFLMTPVPEPATPGLLLAAVASLHFAKRRRRQVAKNSC